MLTTILPEHLLDVRRVFVGGYSTAGPSFAGTSYPPRVVLHKDT
eukprot:COSAG05_NODE_1477_length_4781_cov_6.449381_1_plen_44_part_00